MQKPFSQTAKLAEQQARRKAVISLTPLIDVVFILLVFFMLASSFLDWHSVPLDTPSASTSTSDSTESKPFVVQIYPLSVRLNEQELTLAQLLEKAQARESVAQVVHLQPMADTPVQSVITILDALNQAGIKPLTLIEDPAWKAQSRPASGGSPDALP
jgi:biopolymer transport protein ExbD